MARILIVGGGIGGTAAAYEIREQLGSGHEILLVGDSPSFSFTPSNPWVAVGWREPKEVLVDLADPLGARGIAFSAAGVETILPAENRVVLRDGKSEAYDYLVITTGPKLAFNEVPGLGPEGLTHSICTTPHAQKAWEAYQEFLKNPGPIVVGTAPGVSCFGPAYEFALILDSDLRKRKLRHKVPMTFVTCEPYVGHLGLGGVGDSKGLLESELRKRHIKWITNAKVTSIEKDILHADELDANGATVQSHDVPFSFGMVMPAFTGIDAVMGIEGLVNPRGFVLVDEHQRNKAFPNVFSAGVCVAIPPIEKTPVPTGVPKTGYMIESMVAAIARNIAADIEGKPAEAEASLNAICLADMGDSGIAFVALPQNPPRNATWARSGRWVHLAKVAFEKYYLHKVRTGNVDPIYEKYVLRALGIEKLTAA
jgi:sulfide:quinone oxidoreductase